MPTRRSRQPRPQSGHDRSGVLVIGLGRFGTSLAQTLDEFGVYVLAVDADDHVVQRVGSTLSHTAAADGTSIDALRQLGADQFDRAVVAIATNVEASVLACLTLQDLGVQHIWAKALSEPHRRLLEKIGIDHVVQPEHDMGERMAHQLFSGVTDYLEVDEDFAIIEVEAPPKLIGTGLAESGVRDSYGVTIVCIKPRGGSFSYVTADTVVLDGDLLLVAGTPRQLEHFVDGTA